MQKAQVFLRDDQKAKLKEIAARTGKKQSALIREGIDRIIAENGSASRDDWKRAWRNAAGIWKDRDYIEEMIAEGRKSWDDRIERLRDE